MYRGKDISFIGNVLHGYGEQWLSYDGNTLPRTIAELTPSYDENGTITSDSFAHYIYSHEGTLLGFARKTDGVKYFYRRDAQGNIVAILDNAGAVVVNYRVVFRK